MFITNNIAESLEVTADDERLSLRATTKGQFPDWKAINVIILNPREAEILRDFITNWLNGLDIGVKV